ncbi:MAG: glyoxalase [Planctomycetota bacterium]|nr:glyoxalase [Planctomycetota bacterium]
MAQQVKAVPDGHHTLTPHLIVKGASDAIDFYKTAFGAVEHGRMGGPGGLLMHADLQIGDSHLFLVDEFPAFGCLGPKTIGGTAVTIHLYVEDVDAAFARAVEAGATVKMPLMDMFWGDRYGKVMDPYGHEWSLAQHLADYTPEEMAARGAAAMAPCE